MSSSNKAEPVRARARSRLFLFLIREWPYLAMLALALFGVACTSVAHQPLTFYWLALTPFIGTSVPSHEYTAFAHAAAGQDLKLLQIGMSAAKLLDTVVPGMFVQGRYAYGFSQTVLDISHNRSNADLEVGYFVTPRLRLLALATSQYTHGGIDLVPNGKVVLGNLYQYHDQVSRINFLDLGGGVTFALTDRIDVFGSLLRTVAARNGHAVDHGLSLGLSWGFSTRRAGDRAIAKADRSLAKCLCEKSAS